MKLYLAAAEEMPADLAGVFARFSAECENRTGYPLVYLIVEIGNPGAFYGGADYIAIDAMNAAKHCSPYYTLYFAQGDEASEPIAAFQADRARWLDMMYGATEYFTPAQQR